VKSKRKLWLLLLILPISLVAVGWWSTRPPPLPPFLVKFRDRLKLLDRAHMRSVGSPMLVARTYAVEAVPEEVFVSLIGVEDDASGWAASAKLSGYGESIPIMGFQDGYLSVFTRPDGSRVAVVLVETTEPHPSLDTAVGAVWPGWYEVRFGRDWRGQILVPTGWQEGTFSRKRILEYSKNKWRRSFVK
jgi:hypothetical protein